MRVLLNRAFAPLLFYVLGIGGLAGTGCNDDPDCHRTCWASCTDSVTLACDEGCPTGYREFMPTCGVDAGRVDSGPSPDDGGPIPTDGGPMTTDGGPMTTDAGPMTTDSGPMMTDSGPMTTDGGPMTTDAGPMTTDAGPMTTDAGSDDGGT